MNNKTLNIIFSIITTTLLTLSFMKFGLYSLNVFILLGLFIFIVDYYLIQAKH